MRRTDWRRSSGGRRAQAVLALLVGWLMANSAGAEAPAPPPFYAIDNVRVVTGTGETLESATVLIADGLIEAVGTSVEIPGDAWVINGEGLTLYPGLIDGFSALGQKQEEESTQGAGRGESGAPPGGGPQIRGPEDRPETTPWVSAADSLSDDSRIGKWREAGFTAALSAPREGLFAGQAALISLGEVEPRERVIADGVAQRLNFRSAARRSFPGSLMGVLSYIKQTLSDADHYTEVRTRYEAAPLGRERPTYDRALAPLAEAVTAGRPFLMPADTAVEIDRVLALGTEYELNTVIYGGQGAYARADKLAAAGTPVLVNLDWPEAEKDRDPDADTPFRTLYHRRLAPTTPQVLAAAGVPFAFYAGGLSSPSKIFDKLRQAIDAGLDADDALSALTSDA
ncbi:MAG: hypothetical protein O7A98_03695, partial [Acidobacteria bacterium]|nr:hypothetical protein [Acidobacteriota bacterium]